MGTVQVPIDLGYGSTVQAPIYSSMMPQPIIPGYGTYPAALPPMYGSYGVYPAPYDPYFVSIALVTSLYIVQALARVDAHKQTVPRKTSTSLWVRTSACCFRPSTPHSRRKPPLFQ